MPEFEIWKTADYSAMCDFGRRKLWTISNCQLDAVTVLLFSS